MRVPSPSSSRHPVLRRRQARRGHGHRRRPADRLVDQRRPGPDRTRPSSAWRSRFDATGALQLRLLFERYYAAGLGRFRVSATDRSARRIAPPRYPPRSRTCSPRQRTIAPTQQRDSLRKHFLAVAPELAAARAEIEKLRSRHAGLSHDARHGGAARRRTRRPTHVHHRGEFLQPTRRGRSRACCRSSPRCRRRTPHDRLAFARWLVDPDNPLVGRVTVNRQWAAFFGRGLVRTAEDFGYQGEPPTHPELLDWLAVEFAEPRLVDEADAPADRDQRHVPAVVAPTLPEQLRSDPENLLLARGPRVRLEAELVRDAALRVERPAWPTRSAGRASSRRSRPGVTAEGAYGPLAWKVSEGRTATAAACTRSPSGRPRTRCSARSTPPAARRASPAARSRTRRCRR